MTARNLRPRRLMVWTTLAAALGALALPSPATAAVPDRFGFVLWNGAAVSPTGTFPAATTVANFAVGRYRVAFPNTAAPNGVVHVTAINTNGWCQAAAWGASGSTEFVLVDCYTATGVRANAAFAAMFGSSSGLLPAGAGAFGTVDSTPAGALISQYNSAGAVNSVVHVASGQYEVRLPGLGTAAPNEGSLQATAVNPNVGARCKILRWATTPAAQLAVVGCFDATGGLADQRFTLTYQDRRAVYGGFNPPRHFGYLWNQPPVGPPLTNFNSLAGFGVNTLTPAGLGRSLVRFPQIALRPDDVQVTAYGADRNYCGLQTFWASSGPEVLVRNVVCFQPGGALVNAGFFIAYASAM
jgi:hypothetical protein